ncbi:MAG: alpha/beta fold hydrolase [Bacteroidota bacterium]
MRTRFQFSFIFSLITILFFFASCAPQYRYLGLEKDKVHHFNMVRIGGERQAIMIKGTHPNNPVLLYLHGGPGFPMLPFEPFNDNMKELEKNFTIVYWEQRGTGKSFNPAMDISTMNVEQFVNDTREVVEYIKKKMDVERVFLWGHSWGSNLGAIYASRYPETLHAYISTGQSVNPFRNEQLAYEFVKEQAMATKNKRAMRQLAKIDTLPDNYTVSDALTIRKWVYRYGGIVHNLQNERPYVDIEEIRVILSTPVYPLSVRINLLLDPYYSINNLWDDLKELDLIEKAPRIEVPVYFLVGRHDKIVSHILAEKYFNKLEAPYGKSLIWFEKSAHRPYDEESNKFREVMKQIYQNHWEGGYSRKNQQIKQH